ncbi:MAG: transcription termination/antitermination protein NusA [Elusimicrobia bacterium CG02_land_8_20_14_3_00_37_13]|nr:MAG: transcription termination/antitermination protein NusA [Elusimicrobia bacterium CG02_land_8_20_14_3_00_37_13]
MAEVKSELLPVLEQIEKEKGIKKEEILKVIEGAVISAYKKHVGRDVNVEAKIDPGIGAISACVIKKVVEEIKNPNLEILLQEAVVIDPQSVVGNEIRIPLDTQEFSRIAAQISKQVIIQKIRESERTSLYDEFKAKEGNVVSGMVYRFIGDNIVVDLNKTEGILPVREQSRHENFHVGEHIRVLILNVEKISRGPRILLSRSHIDLPRRLFELEVPEVYEKVVEIVKLVRSPGFRTKIAVISNNPRVDPVGACVGVKGSRIKPIIDELRGERIDLIPYSKEPDKFITSALSPAKVVSVNFVDPANKKAEVIVTDDMLPIAIGKKGSNVALAARLTGWEIRVKSESQKKQEIETKTVQAVETITQLPGVGPKIAEVLLKSGWTEIEKIASAKPDDLTVLHGIGEKTAQSIIDSAKKFLKLRKL